MSFSSDRPVGSIVSGFFNTDVNGVPITLAGSPVINVYKRGNATPDTTGRTLTVDVNGTAGLNSWAIDTSVSPSFYDGAGGDFVVSVSNGTVGGISVIGMIVGEFSLTPQATLLEKTVGAIAKGTVSGSPTTTSVPTSAFKLDNNTNLGSASVDQFKDRVMMFDWNTSTVNLRGVAKAIMASTASTTPTFTVATLPATPAVGDTFTLI